MDLGEHIALARQGLRRGYVQLLGSGAQLLLLLLALQLRTRVAWLLCLGLVIVISVVAWLSALKRLRALRDTPRSTLAAAAQGQVDVAGQGEFFGQPPQLSPLGGQPCLWCRHRVQEKHGDEWKTVDSGETTRSFVLRDASGECVVDPESAEISTRHHRSWTVLEQRNTEWLLLPGDTLQVLGHLRTQGGGTELFDTRAELGALLAEWKQDMPALLARYDSNRDGRLEGEEWESVRRAAMAEVVQLREGLQRQPETHLIGRPPQGGLFLISNLPQNAQQRRYRLWVGVHLAILIGAVWALAWVQKHL